MFSDIFVGIFVFCFNAAPYAFIIAIALTVLNGVRLLMVKRRARRAQMRRTTTKPVKPAFNTFETI